MNQIYKDADKKNKFTKTKPQNKNKKILTKKYIPVLKIILIQAPCVFNVDMCLLWRNSYKTITSTGENISYAYQKC